MTDLVERSYMAIFPAAKFLIWKKGRMRKKKGEQWENAERRKGKREREREAAVDCETWPRLNLLNCEIWARSFL